VQAPPGAILKMDLMAGALTANIIYNVHGVAMYVRIDGMDLVHNGAHMTKFGEDMECVVIPVNIVIRAPTVVIAKQMLGLRMKVKIAGVAANKDKGDVNNSAEMDYAVDMVGVTPVEDVTELLEFLVKGTCVQRLISKKSPKPGKMKLKKTGVANN